MANERDDDDREDGPVDDGESTVVPLEDTETDDEGGEEEAAAPAKPTRGAKKAERGRLREELAERDRTINDMRERMARLETRTEMSERQLTEAARQARSQGGDDDPLAQELDQVYEQVAALSERIVARGALGNKITPEEEREFEKRARLLDQRKATLVARIALREEGGGGGPRQPTPTDQGRSHLMAVYPDVMGNPKAAQWAKGYMQQLMAEMPPTNDAEALAQARQACEEARKKFGPRPTPTANERARTSGVSRGGTGGGNEKDTHFTFDPGKNAHDLKMANVMFSHIKDPKERLKLYAKGPGKKILEKKRAAAGKR